MLKENPVCLFAVVFFSIILFGGEDWSGALIILNYITYRISDSLKILF